MEARALLVRPAGASSKRIGILKAFTVAPDLSIEFGEYADMIESLLSQCDDSLEYVTYDVVDGEYPTLIDECRGYIMTGSALSVYNNMLWIHQLANFVRELHAQQARLLGLCFGHQMIAHALGGRVEKSERGWGIGVSGVTLDADVAVANGLPEKPRLLYSHQDQVVEMPDGAQLLAGNEFCPIAMLAVGDHMLGIQGHPEFPTAYAQALYERRRELYPEALYNQAINSLKEPTDRLEIARWMLEFLLHE